MPGDTGPAQERRAIDTTVAHSARVHDYWLGGKDNISQVVPGFPHSGRTASIQPGNASYSKIIASAVRHLSGPSLGVYVRFIRQVFLTLS
jgi:S-adenosyl methyltransferase